MSHIRPRLFQVLVAGFVLVVASAVTAPTAYAQDDLQERLDRLVERLDELREQHDVPGLSIAVIKDDEVVLATGLGLRDVEKGLPATAETIYGVGSTTKAFTATLVGLMVEDGRLHWDDPVRDHLPWFELQSEEEPGTVTLRDLLSHRTGLTRTGLLAANPRVPREMILRQMAEAEPYAGFRTRFLYNNEQYMCAGYVAGRAAGTTWEDLLRERLLDPLGMDATHTDPGPMRTDEGAARGYQWLEDEGRFDRLPVMDLTPIGPAGSINSNVLEMARWVRMQLNDGTLDGERIVAAETLAETRKPQIAMGPGMGYGLGWMVQPWEGRRMFQHGGNTAGYAAQVAFIPEENVGFVLLCNVTATPLQGLSMPLVFEHLLGDPGDGDEGTPLTEEEMQSYLGRYTFAVLNGEVEVLIENGRLAVDVPGQTTYALKWPDAEGRWYFQLTDQVFLTFADPGEDGVRPTVTFHQAGQEFECPRATPTEDALSPEALEALLARGLGEPLKVYRWTGTTDYVHQGLTARVEYLSGGPGRFKETADFGPFGRTVTVLRDGKLTSRNYDQEPQDAPAESARIMQASHALWMTRDLSDLFEEVRVPRSEEVDGRDCWVAVLTLPGGEDVRLWVDAEHGRPVRAALPMPAAPGVTMTLDARYEDWREVNGAWMPFRQTIETLAIGRIETVITELDPDWRPGEGTWRPGPRRREF